MLLYIQCQSTITIRNRLVKNPKDFSLPIPLTMILIMVISSLISPRRPIEILSFSNSLLTFAWMIYDIQGNVFDQQCSEVLTEHRSFLIHCSSSWSLIFSFGLYHHNPWFEQAVDFSLISSKTYLFQTSGVSIRMCNKNHET